MRRTASSSRAGSRVAAAAVLAVAGVPALSASAHAAPTGAGCPQPAVSSAYAGHEGRVPDPSAAQVAAWERATAARLADGHAAAGRVVVPVVWHIVEEGPAYEQGHLKRKTVRKELRQVARGFRGAESDAAARTPFRFDLVRVTRTENQHYFRDLRWNSPNEKKMKDQLHEGGPETLNIYSVLPVAGVSGWATFPQDYPTAPVMDGVVIHFGVADGSVGGQGDILTHEIGHWLGLYHTFQGGCAAPGDYVDDTPAEASSAETCDVARDTCPADPGDDPVHNYMDYALDVCKDQFTPGQRARMIDHWAAWRAQ